MGVLDRFRRKSQAAGPVVVSRFGMFGPATGLVVAYVRMASGAPRDRWRLFAGAWSDTFRDEVETINAALETIQDARVDPMAGTFYIQAERWAYEQLTEMILATPDEWFEGFMAGERPAVPSGVKSISRDRAVQAAVGLAAMAYGPMKAVGELYGIAGLLVPIESVMKAGPTTTHPDLIENFAGLGPDLHRLA